MSEVLKEVEVLEGKDNRLLTTSSLLRIGEQYYKVDLLVSLLAVLEKAYGDTAQSIPFKEWIYDNENLIDPDLAYLHESYYFLYRGNKQQWKSDNREIIPGIYVDNSNEFGIDIVWPEAYEHDEYSFKDKITAKDADEIRKAIATKEVIICNSFDAASSSIPEETNEDDILKRIVKRAILGKGIDLDKYKVRFINKNMLFNTKQVLRGNNRLSVLLFDRCIDAFNLKYTIIVEEAGGEMIGHPLDGKIIISSHDVVDANMSDSEEIE